MADPEYIPMPGPGEFCKATYRKGERCCLLGWARVAAGATGPNLWPPKDHEFFSRLSGALRSVVKDKSSCLYVDDFNDARGTTDEMRAAVWREAAAALGYVEVDE